MTKVKFRYFNSYRFVSELLLLVLLGFSAACSERKQTQQVLSPNGGNLRSPTVVNINNASAAELAKLPSIGEKRAASIIEYREKYGKFSSPAELILVDGISDRKFRLISSLVKTE